MPHPIHPLHGRQLRAGSAWCASWGNETVASTAVPGEQPAAVLFFATGWFTLGVSLEQFSGVNGLDGRPWGDGIVFLQGEATGRRRPSRPTHPPFIHPRPYGM